MQNKVEANNEIAHQVFNLVEKYKCEEGFFNSIFFNENNYLAKKLQETMLQSFASYLQSKKENFERKPYLKKPTEDDWEQIKQYYNQKPFTAGEQITKLIQDFFLKYCDRNNDKHDLEISLSQLYQYRNSKFIDELQGILLNALSQSEAKDVKDASPFDSFSSREKRDYQYGLVDHLKINVKPEGDSDFQNNMLEVAWNYRKLSPEASKLIAEFAVDSHNYKSSYISSLLGKNDTLGSEGIRNFAKLLLTIDPEENLFSGSSSIAADFRRVTFDTFSKDLRLQIIAEKNSLKADSPKVST